MADYERNAKAIPPSLEDIARRVRWDSTRTVCAECGCALEYRGGPRKQWCPPCMADRRSDRRTSKRRLEMLRERCGEDGRDFAAMYWKALEESDQEALSMVHRLMTELIEDVHGKV